MTSLTLRQLKVKQHLENMPVLAFDVETFPEKGTMRYMYFFGDVWVRKREINPKTGRSHVVKKIEHIEFGSFDQEECLKFLGSIRLDKKSGIPCMLVAFNLKHDYNFIRRLVKEDTLLLSGGRFITCKLDNRIKVVDIFNHAGGLSLDRWIDALNLNDKGIYKTEYREDMTDEEIAQHCRWDAMATYEMAKWYREFFNEHGLDLKLTMGANSLDAFQRKFMEGLYFHRDDGDEANNFIKNAYYGGRVEVWHGYRKFTELACYDINSTYPDAMIHNVFPDPMSMRWGSLAKPEHWRNHLDNHQGFFEVDIYAPRMNIPVLPTREKDGKLMFKCGYLHGIWTAEELRYAQSCGYEILKCYRYLWYKNSIPVFRDFSQWCVDQRAKFPKGTPQNTAFKLLGNSGYGKFGQKNKQNAYAGSLEDIPPDITELIQQIEIHLCDGEEMVSFSGTHEEYSEHSFVELAAYVTAFARLKLTKAAHAVEKAGFIPCYCDTDSLKIGTRNRVFLDGDTGRIAEVLDVGDGLGQWEYEGLHTRYLAAPKIILARDTFGNIDLHDPLNRIKGISKSKDSTYELHWELDASGEAYLETIHAHSRKPITFKEAIIRNDTPSKWVWFDKDLKPVDTKRVWEGIWSAPHYSPKESLPSPYSSIISTNSSESYNENIG